MPSPALSSVDYRALADRWIDFQWTEASGISRCDSLTGGEYIGRNGARQQLSGLLIPYKDPINLNTVSYRLRLDSPGVNVDSRGREKPKNKYLSAPGETVHLYFPPMTEPSWLVKEELPLIVTEGEFKAVALRRLASYQQDNNAVRFLVVGLAGVWMWKGKLGHKPGPNPGEREDIHGAVPDWQRLSLIGRKTIIAFDSDAKSNNQVLAARYELKNYLLSRGANVAFLEWDGSKDRDGKTAKGIDDWIARDGPETVLGAIATVPYHNGADWEHQLLRTNTGVAKGNLENARRALELSPEWQGTLALDTFLNTIEVARRPWNPRPGIWADDDNIQLACWMQSRGIDVSPDVSYAAVRVAARKKNCAQEYLKNLDWDGEPRLDSWLIRYMGARTMRDNVDITNYVCAVGAAWMVGAVARIMDPGCQMDYCLVLYGKEGINKSTAFRVLGGAWFSDSLRDIQSQFAPTALMGRWIIEFSDLEAWGRSEANQLKAFITRRSDYFRPPFGRMNSEFPRTCVFCGSTNDGTFLKDISAEDRRMWPIECRPVPGRPTVDLEALIHDRDQLWAEAMMRYENGAKPYIEDLHIATAASDERESYRITDPWTTIVIRYIDEVRPRLPELFDQPITISEILSGPLRDYSKMSTGDSIRMANILKSIGYSSYQFGQRRQRGWKLTSS